MSDYANIDKVVSKMDQSKKRRKSIKLRFENHVLVVSMTERNKSFLE